MTRWAVFDVDGTLLRGISMERKFIRYLMSNRLLPSGNILLYIFRGFLGVLAHGWEEAIKVNKAYLRGLRVSDIDTYADACFRKHLAEAVAPAGIQTIEQLRQAGYSIMIISGAPSFLAYRLDPLIHPDFVVATRLEAHDGYYTGRVEGLHPFGKRKLAILESLRQQLDIDFSTSMVFANHHSDVDHMKLFGKAVAVNPTAKLLKCATGLGWQITTWT